MGICGTQLSICSMGLHSSCSGFPLFICGGSAPLYFSFADSSLVVAGGWGSSLVVIAGLLSSCGSVLFSNCDGDGSFPV